MGREKAAKDRAGQRATDKIRGSVKAEKETRGGRLHAAEGSFGRSVGAQLKSISHVDCAGLPLLWKRHTLLSFFESISSSELSLKFFVGFTQVVSIYNLL